MFGSALDGVLLVLDQRKSEDVRQARGLRTLAAICTEPTATTELSSDRALSGDTEVPPALSARA